MSLSATTYILQALAEGDFNADGRDDLALAVDNISVFPIRAEVLVLRNTGDGNFAAPADIRLPGLFPRCIEAADVTGDGALDLVVCHSRNVNNVAEGQVSMLQAQTNAGVPTGAFARVFTGPVGTAPGNVAVGDVDRDSRADVVVADPDGNAVYLLYGVSGPAVFAPPVLLDEMIDPQTPLINTLPGQPLPRVLVSTLQGGRLLTFAQVSARTFAEPTDVRIGLLPAAMAQGRIDGDDIDDLVVLSVLGAELWYGEPAGGFAFGESITDDNALTRVTLADLNGDGALDVAASSTTGDRVTVALNGDDVPFTPAPTPTITQTPTRTATGMATATAAMTGGTPGSPTPTPMPGECPGDCNANGSVVVNELILGVNIALENTAISSCVAFDLNADGQVTVNELIAAVNAALIGCPAAN